MWAGLRVIEEKLMFGLQLSQLFQVIIGILDVSIAYACVCIIHYDLISPYLLIELVLIEIFFKVSIMCN